jgi:hypothetical protein
LAAESVAENAFDDVFKNSQPAVGLEYGSDLPHDVDLDGAGGLEAVDHAMVEHPIDESKIIAFTGDDFGEVADAGEKGAFSGIGLVAVEQGLRIVDEGAAEIWVEPEEFVAERTIATADVEHVSIGALEEGFEENSDPFPKLVPDVFGVKCLDLVVGEPFDIAHRLDAQFEGDDFERFVFEGHHAIDEF